MVHAPGIGTARLSPRGDLLDLDDAAAALAGCASTAEARARPDLPMLERARAWVRASGGRDGPTSFDQRWRGAGAMERCVHVTLLPARDARGEVERVEVVLEDVRERVELARAQLFLESILEGLPNPVFVKDEQHRWVLLNDAYCRFMGYERSQLLGKSDHDFFPKEEAEVFWAKDD